MTYDDTLDQAKLYTNIIYDGSSGPCLHCAASGLDTEKQHTEDCPFSTGIWPVGEATHTFYCSGCGEEHTARYACPRCDRYFDDEDFYRLVDEGTHLLITFAVAPSNGIAICLDCATAQAEGLRRLLG